MARGRGPAEATPRVTAAEAGGSEGAGRRSRVTPPIPQLTATRRRGQLGKLLTTVQAPALEVTLGTEARVREATLTTPVSARLGPVVRAGPPREEGRGEEVLSGDTSGTPEEQTATIHMPDTRAINTTFNQNVKKLLHVPQFVDVWVWDSLNVVIISETEW